MFILLPFIFLLSAVVKTSAAAAITRRASAQLQTYDGPKSGRYIVKMKNDILPQEVIRRVRANRGGESLDVTHEWELMNAFAAYAGQQVLGRLLASPEVDYVAEDGILHTCTIEKNAPWGLARLSQATRLDIQDAISLNYSYTYIERDSSDVDIYVLDTGIYIAHSEFGGRARWGATFGNYSDADGHGHGTHVAAIAAGSRFGVAKTANLVAVKVASDKGQAATSDIISGLDYVKRAVTGSTNFTEGSPTSAGALQPDPSSSPNRTPPQRRASVVNMSLGGSSSIVLDEAVEKLIAEGVHIVVAAGNQNQDASLSSPARISQALTVGAMSIDDTRAPFSNFGPLIDVFAPGVGIVSAWIGSTEATNVLSGTSMSSPHIAGLVAYLLSSPFPSTSNNTTNTKAASFAGISPVEMGELVRRLSLKGILKNIPEDTPNYLAQNDIPGQAQRVLNTIADNDDTPGPPFRRRSSVLINGE